MSESNIENEPGYQDAQEAAKNWTKMEMVAVLFVCGLIGYLWSGF